MDWGVPGGQTHDSNKQDCTDSAGCVGLPRHLLSDKRTIKKG